MGLMGTAGELTGIGAGGGGGDGGVSLGTVLLIIFIILIVGGGVAWLAYYLVMKKQFKYKIVIFERVDGRFRPSKKDKAKKMKLSNAGDEVIKLKKHKKTLPLPSIQTGQNTFWYYISDDGEWFNFGPGDFDEDRLELGAEMLDKEMRYARTSLLGSFDERYDSRSWWDKNKEWVMTLAYIVIIGVMVFLVFREFNTIISGSQKAVEASGEVMKSAEKVLSSLNHVCGSSGYTVNGTGA